MLSSNDRCSGRLGIGVEDVRWTFGLFVRNELDTLEIPVHPVSRLRLRQFPDAPHSVFSSSTGQYGLLDVPQVRESIPNLFPVVLLVVERFLGGRLSPCLVFDCQPRNFHQCRRVDLRTMAVSPNR